jgi:transposase
LGLQGHAFWGSPAIAVTSVRGRWGDAARFGFRHHFNSCNGTAWESSSGGPGAPRVNSKGNRKLNQAIHIVAVTEVRSLRSVGNTYYRRRPAEGKTEKEALPRRRGFPCGAPG